MMLRKAVEAEIKATADKGEGDMLKQVMPYYLNFKEECRTVGEDCQTTSC